jgi:transcriptional regulator with XRE-family HTH domain
MTPKENREFFKALGGNLTLLRKRVGLTQVQVAELLGYSQAQIASFESGRRRIPVSALPELAKAYGVSLEELIGDAEIETPRKRGPSSKLTHQIERLSRLPRAQQRVISDLLEGYLQQSAKRNA